MIDPPSSPAQEGAGLLANAVGFWKVANRKLRDLEDKLVNQVCPGLLLLDLLLPLRRQ